MTIEERSCKKTKEKFVNNVISMGKKLSSFWGPPEHIPSLLLCPDWLHSCDQGVGADIAGQILVEVAQKCPGNNFKQKTFTFVEKHPRVVCGIPDTLQIPNIEP